MTASSEKKPLATPLQDWHEMLRLIGAVPRSASSASTARAKPKSRLV